MVVCDTQTVESRILDVISQLDRIPAASHAQERWGEPSPRIDDENDLPSVVLLSAMRDMLAFLDLAGIVSVWSVVHGTQNEVRGRPFGTS